MIVLEATLTAVLPRRRGFSRWLTTLRVRSTAEDGRGEIWGNLDHISTWFHQGQASHVYVSIVQIWRWQYHGGGAGTTTKAPWYH